MDVRMLFASILDVVLPRRARTVQIATCTPSDVPVLPLTHNESGVRIVSLMEYKEPLVEALIRSLKYDRNVHAANILAEILADYLHDELTEASLFSTTKTFLVPIPLHKTREGERGLNQVSFVLSKLPNDLRALVRDDILVRTRATLPQTRLSRAERLVNLKDAFAVSLPNTAGARIILIDDVTTTGATLSEAARMCMEAGATVEALALARA